MSTPQLAPHPLAASAQADAATVSVDKITILTPPTATTPGTVSCTYSVAYAGQPPQPTPHGKVTMTSAGNIAYVLAQGVFPDWTFTGAVLDPGDEGQLTNPSVSRNGKRLTLTDTYTNDDIVLGLHLQLKDSQGRPYESGDPEVENSPTAPPM